MGKKEDIIQQAHDVFYASGFHMSGIAPLLAETGISKRTLYKYFRSKEELIVEVLEYYRKKLFEEIPAEIARRSKSPTGKILAIFDIKAEAVKKGDLRGCLAMKAKLEFDRTNVEIENVCLKFTHELQDYFSQLSEQCGCKHPKVLAGQLMVLLDGAIIMSQMCRDHSVFEISKKAAKQIIEFDSKKDS